MEYITSKNICLLTMDILRLTDEKIMEHGFGVSYIVYRMLESTELFEEFEMAELSFIVSLHNIGGYRTDKTEDLLRRNNKNPMPHCIYGYLFLKNLFPVADYGKVLLYHHMNYDQMGNVDYEFKFLSDFIHIADDAYTNYKEMGGAWDYTELRRHMNKKYSERAYRMLERAEEHCHVFEKISSGEYMEELNQLMDYVLFRDDEKQKYLKMLMYCTGLRSSKVVANTATCVGICDEMTRRLNIQLVDRQRVYLAALLHDIGMLMIPDEILNKAGALTDEEMNIVRTHVKRATEVLEPRFKDQQVVEIVSKHHERLDGSGYPAGIDASKMDKLDRILQTSDAVCGIAGARSYHAARSRDEVFQILQEEVAKKHLDGRIVGEIIKCYDEVIDRIKNEADKILATYRKIEKQYEAACEKML